MVEIASLRASVELDSSGFQAGVTRAQTASRGLQSQFSAVDTAARRVDMRGISQQLSQVGQSTMATGNFVQALAIQLPDIGIMFGAFGAAAGLAAGLMLPLISNLVGAAGASRDLRDDVGDLTSAVNAFKSANDNFSTEGIQRLIDKYGELNDQIVSLIVNERLHRQIVAENAAEALADRIRGDIGNMGLAPYEVVGDRRIRNPQVTALLDGLRAIEEAPGPREQAEAMGTVLMLMRDAGQAGSDLFGELNSAALGAQELAHESEQVPDALRDGTTNAAELTSQVGAAADEAERLKSAINGLDYSNGRRVANEIASQAGRGNYGDLRGAVDSGILDLIAHVEGTDRGRSYNETLGFGAYTGGSVDLVNKTLEEIRDLQRQMLAHPDNNFNSSAVGRYQIVGTTLDGLIKQLGLSMNELFTPALQDRLALELVRQAGGPNGIRATWEGFQVRNTPDAAITQALGSSPQIAAAVAQEAADAERAAASASRESEEATRELDRTRQDAERSAEQQARLTEQAASAFDSLVASIDPAAAAAQQFQQAQDAVNEAVARGVISATEGAAAMEAFSRFQLENSDAAQAVRDANEAQTEAAAQAAAEFGDIWQGAGDSLVDWIAGGAEGGFDALLDIGLSTLDQLIEHFRANPLPIATQGGGAGGGLLGGLGGMLGGPMGFAVQAGVGLLGGLFGRRKRKREERRREEEAEAQADEAMDRELYSAQGNTAALREMELRGLSERNAAMKRDIWAIEDAKVAEEGLARSRAEAAALAEQIAQEGAGIQRQIWELQGNTAAIREAELAALNPVNRAAMQHVFALQDQAAAQEAAAEATEVANRAAEEAAEAQRRAAEEAAEAQRRMAEQRLGLEGQILQLEGNTAEIRRREMAAMDGSLQPFQARIYFLEDERDRLAELERINEQRLGLEGRILELEGNTAELRRRETAALDGSLGPYQARIYFLEDERERLAELERINDERLGLEGQLLELQGNTAELRRRELEQLDPTNRALKLAIYGLQDLNEVLSDMVEADYASKSDFERVRGLAANRNSGLVGAGVPLAAVPNSAPVAVSSDPQLVAKVDHLTNVVTQLLTGIESNTFGIRAATRQAVDDGVRITNTVNVKTVA